MVSKPQEKKGNENLLYDQREIHWKKEPEQSSGNRGLRIQADIVIFCIIDI